MRELKDLIDDVEPGWPLVEGWLAGARHAVEVLPADPAQGDQTLLALQVTTRSPMGAIAHRTGGLLVDGGWVQVLGSGSPRLPGTLASWNGLGPAPLRPALPGRFIIALDVLGGLFALSESDRLVHYLAPDSLRWENLGGGYSDTVAGLLLQGDLERFYTPYRWPGWRDDLAALRGDQGWLLSPPLWTKEGKDATRQRRRPVPLTELLTLTLDLQRQLDGA